MFVQTEITPNPNSLKFIPGKPVSNNGSFEIIKKDIFQFPEFISVDTVGCELFSLN